MLLVPSTALRSVAILRTVHHHEGRAPEALGCWNTKLHDNYSECEAIGSCAFRGMLPRTTLVSPSHMTWAWRLRDEVKHQGWPAQPSINPQPLTAEDRDRHRASPREICGGQLGSRRGFSSNVSILPCQYQSSNNPYSCKFADFLRGVVEDYCLLECRAAP